MSENPNAIMTREMAAIAAVNSLMSIVRTMRADVFMPGTDFGVIPGTNDKPVLLLPGMEKLLRALKLTPKYIPLTIIQDFDKPLFFYRYECQLTDQETGIVVGSAIGSANSHETKWRYRNANRVCPTCGKEAIIKGKAEYGGGWLCYKNKGGCGAKFGENDESITKQVVGRVENADIADQVGTIDKIAQKRALASAIKQTAAVSELFTVDLEDMPGWNVQVTPPDEDVVILQSPASAPPPQAQGTAATSQDNYTAKSARNAAKAQIWRNGQWER